jgi:hypothetical protein
MGRWDDDEPVGYGAAVATPLETARHGSGRRDIARDQSARDDSGRNDSARNDSARNDSAHGDVENEPGDPGRRRLVVGGLVIAGAAALGWRTVTARSTPERANPDLSSVEADRKTSVNPPSSTDAQPVDVTNDVAQPDGDAVDALGEPAGALIGWYGSTISSRQLGASIDATWGRLYPLEQVFLASVPEGIVAFGQDARVEEGGAIGLWLLRDDAEQRLIIEAPNVADGGGAGGGRLWVRRNDGLVQLHNLSGERPSMPFAVGDDVALVGSTAAGVLTDKSGLISWVTPNGWSSSTRQIGRGVVIDSSDYCMLWRTDDGGLVITDVNTALTTSPVDSDSARFGALYERFGILRAAVLDQNELIVWRASFLADEATDVVRFPQDDLLQVLWLTDRHLLLLRETGAAEVLDLDRKDAVTVRLPGYPITMAWRPLTA